jgi:hypothetical protein
MPPWSLNSGWTSSLDEAAPLCEFRRSCIINAISQIYEMRALADRAIHRNAKGVLIEQFFRDERLRLKAGPGARENAWAHRPT